METIGYLFWIFIFYSVAGWCLETVSSALRKRQFVNRGFLNGPVCTIYGTAAILMTVFLGELRGNWIFLFIGCFITASVVELVSGMVLERMGVGKWWDYSNRKYNLGGYIWLGTGLLWGLLGVVCVTWVNPLLRLLYDLIPEPLRTILLLVIFGILAVDWIGSFIAIGRIKKLAPITEANERIEEATQFLGNSITAVIARRLEKAHPHAVGKRKKVKKTVFAQGCGFQKLFMLLIIGAFLGDIAETLFCRVTGGVWMSRSSLVWGQFSMVWGIGIAALTAMLYRYRDRSDSFLFVIGFLLGGAYEYFCSVFTELAFGTVFWDYSTYPFNLGGRINLLYCFFWGIACVLWLKKLYPVISRWIERIPMKIGSVAIWVLAVFLAVDVIVTCGAMVRYTQRDNGVEATNPVAVWLDASFPDDWMEQRYRNMKFTK